MYDEAVTEGLVVLWEASDRVCVREAGVVVDTVDRLRGALPFPLRGIDTDNGSEFLNEVLIGFCSAASRTGAVSPRVVSCLPIRSERPKALLRRARTPIRTTWLPTRRHRSRVCGEAMGREACAGCFDDPGYFESILELTAARLAAVRGLRLTVLSSYMKRELIQAGVPADRISVVPPVVYGLDPGAPADGPPCVLFAGRVVEAKGISEAIDAWRRSGSGLPLVVAGTGPLRREIDAEGVEVLGWLDRRRLSAAYRRAAVLVMPSRWQEPFGIGGLEALTLGTPVAAWDSGGVREWHPGGELLVP